MVFYERARLMEMEPKSDAELEKLVAKGSKWAKMELWARNETRSLHAQIAQASHKQKIILDQETKSMPSQFKAIEAGLGRFEGYLAVFGNLDSNGDIIDKGAFTRTLNAAKQRKAQSGSPYLWPLLWQHDSAEPIGGITDAYEDSHGLYIKAEFDLDIPKGQQAYSGAKMGYLDGMSIGYITVKSVGLSDGRHLTEIKLFEGSVVTLPANDMALITSVKSLQAQETVPEAEPLTGTMVVRAQWHIKRIAWERKEDPRPYPYDPYTAFLWQQREDARLAREKKWRQYL